MAGLTSKQVDTVILALRKTGGRTAVIQGQVLTPTNQSWNALTLYGSLRRNTRNEPVDHRSPGSGKADDEPDCLTDHKMEWRDRSMRDEKKQQKETLKEEMLRLGNLQRECKEEKIPVYITFDGYDGAGKGVQIGRLMQALDPRGFDVYTGDKDTEEEALRPFLWRFAVHAPADGRITIYDTSWYRRVQADRFEGKLNEKKADAAFEDICAFERCLVDGGTVLIKFF